MLRIAIYKTEVIRELLESDQKISAEPMSLAVSIENLRYSLLWSLLCHVVNDQCVIALIWKNSLPGLLAEKTASGLR